MRFFFFTTCAGIAMVLSVIDSPVWLFSTVWLVVGALSDLLREIAREHAAMIARDAHRQHIVAHVQVPLGADPSEVVQAIERVMRDQGTINHG